MNIRLYWIVLFNVIFSTLNAQSFLSKVDSLEIEYKFYVSKNSTTIYLTSLGSLERQFPKLVFKRIDHDKISGLTTIEGLVDNCCFEILVAKVKNKDVLTNIRRFGQTEETIVTNDEEYTGRFSIKTKFKPNDVLVIGHPGTLYWGGTIVAIGKIFSK